MNKGMRNFILGWMERIIIALRGAVTWSRVGYLFILLPGIFLLVMWLLGYGWIELTIIFALGMIFIMAEMFNYAIEKLCNLVGTGTDNEIGAVKDVCAGAVLVSGVVLITVWVYIII